MTHQPNDYILIHVLSETRQRIQSGEPQTLVFDLDSTLFDVTERNQRILREFIASEHLESHPELRESFKRVQMQLTDHGLESAVRRAGVEFHNEELKQKLILFWRERFFSDSYLESDHCFPGAAEYVRELHSLGASICYLTGRDRIRMGVGTPKQLLQWKFPFNEARTQLIMKPQKGMDDALFKVEELKKLKNVNWFFENEPKIIHLTELELPQIKIIFFESSHSGKAAPKEQWTRIKSYKR